MYSICIVYVYCNCLLQNILEYTDSKCSGRQSCQIPVTEVLNDGIKPCPKDLMPFMLAAYKCVPGKFTNTLTLLQRVTHQSVVEDFNLPTTSLSM